MIDLVELLYVWRKKLVRERLKDHDRHLRLLDNTLKLKNRSTANLTLDDTGQDLVQTSVVGAEDEA